MIRTIPIRSLVRYACGFVALAFVAATCRDLTGPTGVATEGGPISVVYGGPTDSNGVVQLTVGDKISPPVTIRIRGTVVTRARYVFSNMDTSVLKVSKNGDSLYAVARGRDTVVVALIGSTIGGTIDPGSTLKDTVLVAVKPARNLVTTNPIPTLRSFGDSAIVSAESRDINNVRTKAGKVRWYAADPTLFAVDSVGTTNADGTNTTAVSALRNGTADLITIFDDVETVRTPVTVQQTAAKYLLRSRFGGGVPGTPVDFRSLGDTATLVATPADARGNPLATGSLSAPTPTFAVSPPGKVSVNAVSGLLTANFNTDLGAPVTATATGGSGSTTLTSDPLAVVVQQVATSIAIIGKRVDTIPSIGSTKDLTAIVKDARGNDVQTGITWTSRNTAVAQFRTSATGDVALAIDTGTTRFVVTRDQVADSITVVVTNDPETVELRPDTVFIRSLDEIKRFTSLTVRNFKGDALANIPITWTSADPTIVQANADSTIVGKAVGATNVTARTPNGKTATSRVVVTNAPAILDILPANSTLASVGDTLLNIAVDFRNGLGVALPRSSASWSSTDVNVATVNVDPSGNVRIIAAGTGNTYVRAVSPVDALVRDSVFVTVTNAPASIVAAPNPAPTITALGSTVTFTATVFNASGNPIPTAKLRWSVVSGVSVSIDSVTGVATALLNGSSTIRATSGMITTDIPLTVAQAIAGTRSTISAGVSSLTADGTSSTSITVQLKDANDNPIAFGGSTVVLTTSLGTLGSTNPTDNGNGQYITTLTAGTLTGSASVTGTVNGNAITNNAIVAFTAAAANKYIVTPTNLTPVAGTSVIVRAQLADGNNNPIPTAGSIVQFTSTNGGSFSPANGLATTDGAGIATITFLTNTTTSAHTITATTGGITGSSVAIVTVAGAAAKYLVTPSTTSPVAGSAVTVTAQLADANNNVVAQQGQTASWSHTGSGSFPGGATDNSTTNTSGVATISFTTAATSGQTATVTATTGGITGTSASITTVTGTATQLAVILPPSANPQSGVPFPQQPTIQLRDAQGNAVSAVNVSIAATITAGGGSLGGLTTVQTDPNGLATFSDLTLTGFIGARTLTFSATGLSPTSASVTLVAGNAAQLTVSTAPSANPQNGIAFGTQPALQLRDAQGNVVTTGGVIVTAAITSGGGNLTGPSGGVTATTLGTGVATFQDLTVTGTIGARTLSFTSPGLTSATATVTLIHGALHHFLVESAAGGAIPSQVAGTSFNIRVVAQDLSDNVVTAFSGGGNTTNIASPNGATFSAGSGATPAFTNGVLASRAVTITNGGTFSISATRTAGAETGTSNAFPVLLAAQYIVTAAPSVLSGNTIIVSAQLADAAGTPVPTPGKTISWSKTGPGGTFATPTSLTDATGMAEIAFTGTAAGVHTITATDNTSLTGTSGAVTVVAGGLATFLVEANGSGAIGTQTAGVPFLVQITARDASNNIVTAFSGGTNTVTLTASSAISSGGGVTAVFTNGVLTGHSITLNTSGLGQGITATRTSGGIQSGTSAGFTIDAAALDNFLVTNTSGGPIATQTAGAAFNVRVQARDQFSNIVTAYSGAGNQVNFSSSSAIGSGGGTSPAFINGVLASHTITLNTAGASHTITATRTTGGAQSGTSVAFAVDPGAATQLVMVQQPSATSTAGVIFAQQPIVEVRDALNNVVTSDNSTSVTAAATGGTGVLIGLSVRTAVNGVVSYSGLRYDQAETITLGFTSTPALTPTSSSSITVSPNTLDHFAISPIATPQVAGTGFTITITAQDVFNNTVTSFSGVGSTVVIRGEPGTVVLGEPVTSGTFISGVRASQAVTVTTGGASSAIHVVRTGGTEAGQSNDFGLDAGPADHLDFGTQPVTTQAGAIITPPVTVEVRDQYQNIVTTDNTTVVTLAIGANPGAGTLSGTLTRTVVNGAAVFTNVSINNTGTGYTLTATSVPALGLATSSLFNIIP